MAASSHALAPAVKHALLTLLLAALAPCAALAQQSDAISADVAAHVLSQGAVVVDLRPATEFLQGHLPGAVSLPQAASAADRDTLQQLVSRHGIDLSRGVVLMGQPGDVQAQALQARLAAYATGRVQWLVGGANEWALSGRPLATTSAPPRAPVPQHLVRLAPQDSHPRMAGASLRDVPERAGTRATASTL